ncbi:MAG TPA: radical SAM family heme chaperone HemW [Syntrophorhabdus sp.]|nr:radical SAM family heme chaperone HemW [Syntrophorhabdus sp.]
MNIKDRAKRGNRMNPQSDNMPGLYIHIPFCKTKCPYCDFYSVTNVDLAEEWLTAILKEMSHYSNIFGTFDTLYLGGGTPTVLSNTVLVSLFRELRRHFNFHDDTEITVEANPNDITLEKLALFKLLGVNRLSIGAQSFNDEELLLLKRRHSVKGIEEALYCVNQAGFLNFGIDLIYGIPGQPMASWITSLQKALGFKPTHLSCYQLTIEQTTPFGKMLQEGNLQGIGEKQGKNFFLTTSRFLENNGFMHYEISNFSRKKRFRSRHNLKYWKHVPYLGLGPGAHSFLNGKRWWNVKSVKDYCYQLSQGLKPIQASESLSPEQLRLEKLFLGLRTNEGIKIDVAFPDYQTSASLENMVKNRLITVRGDRLIPTKKGFLMADRLPLLFP